ncbi:alpha/beta fold hydrolase [Micromonospora endolithica]|uniref:Alpha/beta hydrolase n=1 Tax=Micromonospora endolithica TaxID=230091 RepID=A0A3A9YZL5_9ACTN|nr:alpha/beta hydrolase [Micromonospora endolithica]RKN40626.1 alpha/beta hydrolase [Micromonospora endolithica]TWJ21711.1 pimeloyl-ACP methyl ester carboxylesterase [Micromonospora endolithica]
MVVNLFGKLGNWLRRRRRPLVRVAVVLTVIAVAVAYLLKDPAPVGYFTSTAAQDRFRAAYREAMTDLPPPDRTLDVRTGYGVVRLYHFRGGTDPAAAPLLLLPGRASASPVWADNLPSLLRLRSVYTVDLLGEPGMSIQSRAIDDATDHARWLSEVLHALPEPRIHLLGVSFGGWTAMNLAVHRPEKVAGVVLLDPVLVFADLSLEVILRSIPVSFRWAPRSWRDSFASWTANGAPVTDVPVARMIEAGLQAYVVKLSAPARPSADQLAAVDVPVLVLMAGSSRLHDSGEAADTARRTLARGSVKTYPEASHAINGEYPDRIAADVAAFLAGA